MEFGSSLSIGFNRFGLSGFGVPTSNFAKQPPQTAAPKLYFLARYIRKHATYRSRHRKQKASKSAYLRTGAPLRDQSNGNKSYFLTLGTATIILALGGTSRPKKRQQIVLPNIGAPLRDQSSGNKLYILALRHHFGTKATATNRIS